MELKSGVFDIYGTEIKSGDRVEITIHHSNGISPTVFERNIGYLRGAFRMIDDEGREYTPIGDLAYNCDIKILEEK